MKRISFAISVLASVLGSVLSSSSYAESYGSGAGSVTVSNVYLTGIDTRTGQAIPVAPFASDNGTFIYSRYFPIGVDVTAAGVTGQASTLTLAGAQFPGTMASATGTIRPGDFLSTGSTYGAQLVASAESTSIDPAGIGVGVSIFDFHASVPEYTQLSLHADYVLEIDPVSNAQVVTNVQGLSWSGTDPSGFQPHSDGLQNFDPSTGQLVQGHREKAGSFDFSITNNTSQPLTYAAMSLSAALNVRAFPVPEPASYALMLAGVLALVGVSIVRGTRF